MTRPFAPTRLEPLRASKYVQRLMIASACAYMAVWLINTGFAAFLAGVICITAFVTLLYCTVVRRSPRRVIEHERRFRKATVGVRHGWAEVSLVMDGVATVFETFGIVTALLHRDASYSDAAAFDFIMLFPAGLCLWIYSHDKATYVLKTAEEPITDAQEAA